MGYISVNEICAVNVLYIGKRIVFSTHACYTFYNIMTKIAIVLLLSEGNHFLEKVTHGEGIDENTGSG